MKSVLSFILPLLTIVLFSSSTCAENTSTQSTSGLTSIAGTYKQTQIEPALKNPLTLEGAFLFDEAFGLIWAFQKPEISASYVSKKGTLYQLKQNKWSKAKGKASKEMNHLINLIINQNFKRLEKRFKVTSKKESNIEYIKLIPSHKKIARFINEINIKKGQYLENIDIFKKNGSSLSLAFSEQHAAPTFSPTVCQQKLHLNQALCNELSLL